MVLQYPHLSVAMRSVSSARAAAACRAPYPGDALPAPNAHSWAPGFARRRPRGWSPGYSSLPGWHDVVMSCLPIMESPESCLELAWNLPDVSCGSQALTTHEAAMGNDR